jgi:hypothetical protein
MSIRWFIPSGPRKAYFPSGTIATDVVRLISGVDILPKNLNT